MNIDAMNFVNLPSTVFEAITRHLDNVQDVLNLEAVHPAIKSKLSRMFWGQPRALLIGETDDSIAFNYYRNPSQNLVRLRTSDNHLMEVIPPSTSAFCNFCGYISSRSSSPLLSASYAGEEEVQHIDCYDLFERARNLHELEIGPVKKISALHRFLSFATESDLELCKISLIYARPELMHSQALSTTDCFPTKATHSKIVKLVKNNSESLDEIKIYLNQSKTNFVSIHRDLNGRVVVEYNCECSMELRQIIHPFISALTYHKRPGPTCAQLNVSIRDRSVLSAVDFCITTSIPFEYRPDVRSICIDIQIQSSQKDALNEVENDEMYENVRHPLGQEPNEKRDVDSVLHAAMNVVSNADIFPSSMKNVESITWKFSNLKLNAEQFQKLCEAVRPFRSAVLMVRTPGHSKIIGDAATSTMQCTMEEYAIVKKEVKPKVTKRVRFAI